MASTLNALYISDSSPGPSSPRPRLHSRTFSTATLETSGSHPTEPLLHHHQDASGSGSHQPLYNRPPSNPDGTHSNWDMLDISSDGDFTTPEKRRYGGHQFQRRRSGIWRGVGLTLEVVLGLWTIYNTIRYFIAYTIYSSMVGQTFALALGCTTAVTFAFLVCEGVMAALQTRLIASRVSVHSLYLLRTVFLYFSSFLLISTSIINLVVTVLWRRSQTSELDAELRCNLDVDITWSVSSSKPTCSGDSSKWTGWIALAIFRVAFTLTLVLSMLLSYSQNASTRRPSQYTYRPHRKRRRWRKEKEPQKGRASSTLEDNTSVGEASAATSTQPVTSTVTGSLRHPPSRSTTNSRQYSHNDCPAGSSTEGDVANCRRGSDEDLCLDPDVLAQLDPAALQQRLTDAIYLSPGAGGLAVSSLPDPLTIRDDRDLTNFVNRFRTLVSQITRETDDALEYARSDTFVRPVDEDESDEGSDEESRYGFGYGYPSGAGPNGGGSLDYPPFPPPALGYDEFGRPYPPEDHVRILNSYVRRMPTIESLGSREFVGTPRTNSVYSGSFGRLSLSMQTLSRPQTAMMNHSELGGGSEASSRRASLSLNTAGLGMVTGAVGVTGGTGSVPQTPRTPGAEDGLLGNRQLQESPIDAEPGVLGRSGLPPPPPPGRLASHSSFSYHTANSGGGSTGSPASEGYVSFSSEDSKPARSP